MTAELQHTLAKSAGFSGISLHTGEKVTLKLQPAPVDHGIKFKRKDLADEPTIDANIANLKTVERATTIGEGAVRVHTVEHVLSALNAMGVDNAIVEMTANEPPIGDGSAAPYVEVIKKAGMAAQEAPRRFFDVREPIHVESKSGSLLVLLPDDKFRVSCTQAGPDYGKIKGLAIDREATMDQPQIVRRRRKSKAKSLRSMDIDIAMRRQRLAKLIQFTRVGGFGFEISLKAARAPGQIFICFIKKAIAQG